MSESKVKPSLEEIGETAVVAYVGMHAPGATVAEIEYVRTLATVVGSDLNIAAKSLSVARHDYAAAASNFIDVLQAGVDEVNHGERLHMSSHWLADSQESLYRSVSAVENGTGAVNLALLNLQNKYKKEGKIVSYDVSFCTAGSDEFELFNVNHTSNTKSLWVERGLILEDWEGKKASSMQPAVMSALIQLIEDSPSFEGNGWGTLKTTQLFLAELIKASLAVPDSIVRISK